MGTFSRYIPAWADMPMLHGQVSVAASRRCNEQPIQMQEVHKGTTMIWEGKKREPSKPVTPLDLTVRLIVDEKYIIPTIYYIKRNACDFLDRDLHRIGLGLLREEMWRSIPRARRQSSCQLERKRPPSGIASRGGRGSNQGIPLLS